MKKIINRKRYDTETAKEVALWSTGGSINDFEYAEECLHLKKTGEYFLYGKGHGLSRWSKSSKDGSSRGWGEDIQPLTEDQAREWVENYANEQYETLFGEVEE